MSKLMNRVVPVGLAIAVAGCGATTIDGGKLEDEIREDAEREGLVVDDAECPSPDAEEGATFECTVTVKGEERQLEVTQRDDDGNVGYDLGPLVESRAGADAGGDEAAVRFVIEALNRDATALCDYATRDYRAKLARRSRRKNCAQAVLAKGYEPMRDYEVSVDGDTAAAAAGGRSVTLRRQRDGSWLVSRAE